MLRFLLAASVTVGLGALPFLLPASWETAATICALVALLLGLPVTIATLLDITQDASVQASPWGWLLRVPAMVFGLVSCVIGLSITGWVLYNVFVERLPEYTGPGNVVALFFCGFGMALPMVAFGWHLLRGQRQPDPDPYVFNSDLVEAPREFDEEGADLTWADDAASVDDEHVRES